MSIKFLLATLLAGLTFSHAQTTEPTARFAGERAEDFGSGDV